MEIFRYEMRGRSKQKKYCAHPDNKCMKYVNLQIKTGRGIFTNEASFCIRVNGNRMIYFSLKFPSVVIMKKKLVKKMCIKQQIMP